MVNPEIENFRAFLENNEIQYDEVPYRDDDDEVYVKFLIDSLINNTIDTVKIPFLTFDNNKHHVWAAHSRFEMWEDAADHKLNALGWWNGKEDNKIRESVFRCMISEHKKARLNIKE